MANNQGFDENFEPLLKHYARVMIELNALDANKLKDDLLIVLRDFSLENDKHQKIADLIESSWINLLIQQKKPGNIKHY